MTSPASGATAQELLESMLPLVVKAASDAAASSTAAAVAVTSVEATLNGFKASLDNNTAAVLRLAEAQEDVNKARDNNQQWLRTLVTPQTLLMILVIVGSAFGLRMSFPAPVSLPISVEPGILTP